MQEQIKRRRGPAPSPEQQKRKTRISVYLTDAEYSELLSRVKHKDDLAPYMRAQAFTGKTPLSVEVPAVNLKTYAELARAAGNLNQIARHLNGGEAVDMIAIQQALEAFRQSLVRSPSQ